jgi:hypothetical protein
MFHTATCRPSADTSQNRPESGNPQKYWTSASQQPRSEPPHEAAYFSAPSALKACLQARAGMVEMCPLMSAGGDDGDDPAHGGSLEGLSLPIVNDSGSLPSRMLLPPTLRVDCLPVADSRSPCFSCYFAAWQKLSADEPVAHAVLPLKGQRSTNISGAHSMSQAERRASASLLQAERRAIASPDVVAQAKELKPLEHLCPRCIAELHFELRTSTINATSHWAQCLSSGQTRKL